MIKLLIIMIDTENSSCQPSLELQNVEDLEKEQEITTER